MEHNAETTHDNRVGRMRIACWLHYATLTLRICIIYFFHIA